jgi:hypothetical protein
MIILNRIFSETGITASFNDSIEELIRGIRYHLPKLLKSNDKIIKNQ